MWLKSENSEITKPLETEVCGNIVIVRRNFNLVEGHWAYEEWQMTSEQYEVYRSFSDELSEQSDALIELAELISEVI